MRVWTTPTADDLTDMADAEHWTDLYDRGIPETHNVAALPYAQAFGEYVAHFEGCPDCRAGRPCLEGDDRTAIARVGVEVQAEMARWN